MNAPASTAFIQAVMTRLKASGPTELAAAMGWRDWNAPNNVGRWIRGSSAPSYEPLMEMLERCGWLTKDAQKAIQKAALKEAARVVGQAVADAPKPQQPPGNQARRASK